MHIHDWVFHDLYLWSFEKIALVASAAPCAPTMDRTQLAVTPSHNRTAPSLDAVTYMPPVEEYLTCKIHGIDCLNGPGGSCEIWKTDPSKCEIDWVDHAWFMAPLTPISGAFEDR